MIDDIIMNGDDPMRENFLPFFSPVSAICLIYIQISNQKIKKSLFFGILILFLFVDYLTESIILLMFLIGLFLYSKFGINLDKKLSVFYSIYSVFWTILLSDVFETSFLMINGDFSTLYQNIIHYSSFLSAAFVNFLTFKLFDLDVIELRRDDTYVKENIVNKLNKMMGISFLIYLSIIMFVELASNQINYAISATIFMLTQLLLYFIFVGLLSTKIKNYLRILIGREKDKRYQQLKQYTDDIEMMQSELAGFNHDIKNILISYGEVVRSKKLDLIESEFNDIKKQLDFKLEENNIASPDLKNIKNPMIKGLLHQKEILAKQNNISLQFDIKDEIDQINMNKLNFIRIIGILLDNAIEEAVNSKRKKVIVGFVIEKNKIILDIVNSTDKTQIPLNEMFRDGYSTKEGEIRGKGLAIVWKLLQETINVKLQTNFNNQKFTQSLIIWNIDEI